MYRSQVAVVFVEGNVTVPFNRIVSTKLHQYQPRQVRKYIGLDSAQTFGRRVAITARIENEKARDS